MNILSEFQDIYSASNAVIRLNPYNFGAKDYFLKVKKEKETYYFHIIYTDDYYGFDIFTSRKEFINATRYNEFNNIRKRYYMYNMDFIGVHYVNMFDLDGYDLDLLDACKSEITQSDNFTIRKFSDGLFNWMLNSGEKNFCNKAILLLDEVFTHINAKQISIADGQFLCINLNNHILKISNLKIYKCLLKMVKLDYVFVKEVAKISKVNDETYYLFGFYNHKVYDWFLHEKPPLLPYVLMIYNEHDLYFNAFYIPKRKLALASAGHLLNYLQERGIPKKLVILDREIYDLFKEIEHDIYFEISSYATDKINKEISENLNMKLVQELCYEIDNF